MKRILFVVLMLIASTGAVFAQSSATYLKLRVVDSIRVGDRSVKEFSTDPALTDSADNILPTQSAVKAAVQATRKALADSAAVLRSLEPVTPGTNGQVLYNSAGNMGAAADFKITSTGISLSKFAETQTKAEIQNNAVNGGAFLEVETFSGPGAQARIVANSDLARLSAIGDTEAALELSGQNTSTGIAKITMLGDGGNFIDHDVDLSIRDMSSGTPVVRNIIYSDGRISGTFGTAPNHFATVAQLPTIPPPQNLQSVLTAGNTADADFHIDKFGYLEASFQATNGMDYIVSTQGGSLFSNFSSINGGSLFMVSAGGAASKSEIQSRSFNVANGAARLVAYANGTDATAWLNLQGQNNTIQFNTSLGFYSGLEGEGTIVNTLVGNGQMTGADATAANQFATLGQIESNFAPINSTGTTVVTSASAYTVTASDRTIIFKAFSAGTGTTIALPDPSDSSNEGRLLTFIENTTSEWTTNFPIQRTGGAALTAVSGTMTIQVIDGFWWLISQL